MDRRKFLYYTGVQLAGLSVAASCNSNRFAIRDHYRKPVLLSTKGCGRATAYAEANKIVTLAGKTHLTWLDSVDGQFQVKIRTLNRKSKQWSPVYEVGEAYDNHGGAALSVDSRGFLHIVYYPHHHAMRYRRSRRPNDASEWEDVIRFGEACTYPTLVCGPDDKLYFTCRRQRSDQFWQVELWTKAADQSWQLMGPILQARYTGYAHFQESLAWSRDHQTLFLSCRIHEKTDDGAYGRLQTVGFMMSRDFGRTWEKSNGDAISLPATAETIEVLESGGLDQEKILRAGAMAVDEDSRPYLVYSIQEKGRGQSILATLQQKGGWKRTILNAFLLSNLKDHHLIMPGGISFNTGNEMFIVGQTQQIEPGAKSWGDPTDEVVLLCSKDLGRSFTCVQISPSNPQIPHWLPNIERPTGHHEIEGFPGIIYTAGTAGEKNLDILANEVYFLS